jgi:predicted metal-dependent hydrolase
MAARDRDPSGRPRNARPRDASGRPLSHGAAGVERVPEDLVLTSDEAVTEAQRLLDADLPFAAHEVLEGAWKAAPAAERELWRGLAQLAVGLTHAQRGNARGAVALLSRAADRIGSWSERVPAGLDPSGLAAWATALAYRIERAEALNLDATDLRPSLRAAAPDRGRIPAADGG